MKSAGKSNNSLQWAQSASVSAHNLLYTVVDSKNRILAYMSTQSIMEQKLMYRKVCVALYTHDFQLVLHKQAVAGEKVCRSVWGLFCQSVPKKTSCLDTAEAALVCLGLARPVLLKLRQEYRADEQDHSFRSVFAGMLSVWDGGRLKELPESYLLVDADELRGLVADMPELFSVDVQTFLPVLQALMPKERK